MRYTITTDIDAPPDVVFAVLTDIDRWPEWTATVTRVERLGDAGTPFGLGSRVRIIQPKVPPAEWTVTAFETGRGFQYRSHSPGATVEADHWIEPLDGGRRSRVTLTVTFSGFLGKLIGRLMRKLNESYIAQEAAGLKQESEKRAREQGR